MGIGSRVQADRDLGLVLVPENSQTIKLLAAYTTHEQPGATGGGEVVIEDNTLVPMSGPAGTEADIVQTASSDRIFLYEVRDGDTLGHIAELYDVRANTIRWANDLNAKDTIRPGQVLLILPIDGVSHKIAKGDTIASVAKKYGGDAIEIAQFNGIEENAKLAVGEEIIIPNGEIEAPKSSSKSSKKSSSSSSSVSKSSSSYNSNISAGYYMHPLAGKGRKSQGIHGRNSVDIAAPYGTPIVASAAGTVIRVSSSGWGGGYGKYIIVNHSNGTQTLYAHNSKNVVSPGQQVKQGQKIAEVGSTGRSTGNHVHFEIRNGPRNPF